MKALILSDIHANIYALEAIWRHERDADLILCAGDVVDYGPNPCEVLAWLRDHNVHCVQGNHDAWVALNYRQGNSPVGVSPEDLEWVHHTVEMLDDSSVAFLEALPQALTLEIDGLVYGLKHIFRDYNEIVSLHAFYEFRRAAFDPVRSDRLTRLILGHTHRQSVRYLSDTHLWLNPGSASYRRKDDPDQTAHYATLIDGAISLKRLEYDISPLYSALERIHLKPDEMRIAYFYFGPRP